MSQPVNPQIAQLKQGVFALMEQTLMGKQVFDSLMGNFTVKLLELSQTNLAGKDETFVAVHSKYIQVITASQQNLKAQYDVGREILEAAGKVFDSTSDLMEIQVNIGPVLASIQAKLKPLLETQHKLDQELGQVEAQYVRLLPVQIVLEDAAS